MRQQAVYSNIFVYTYYCLTWRFLFFINSKVSLLANMSDTITNEDEGYEKVAMQLGGTVA